MNEEYEIIEAQSCCEPRKRMTFSPIMESMAGPLPELAKEKGAEYIRLVITKSLPSPSIFKFNMFHIFKLIQIMQRDSSDHTSTKHNHHLLLGF